MVWMRIPFVFPIQQFQQTSKRHSHFACVTLWVHVSFDTSSDCRSCRSCRSGSSPSRRINICNIPESSFRDNGDTMTLACLAFSSSLCLSVSLGLSLSMLEGQGKPLCLVFVLLSFFKTCMLSRSKTRSNPPCWQAFCRTDNGRKENMVAWEYFLYMLAEDSWRCASQAGKANIELIRKGRKRE